MGQNKMYKGTIMNHAQEQRRKQAVVRYLAGDKIEAICRDLHCSKSWLYKWKARGIRVRRDNWASVRYAEGLNSSKSSVTLRSTDRHDILGQKSAGFQLSLGERYAECAPDCPQD